MATLCMPRNLGRLFSVPEYVHGAAPCESVTIPSLFAPIGSIIPSFVYTLRRGNAKHSAQQRRLSIPMKVGIHESTSVRAGADELEVTDRISAISPVPKQKDNYSEVSGPDSSVSTVQGTGSGDDKVNEPSASKFYTTTRRTSLHSHRDSLKMGKNQPIASKDSESNGGEKEPIPMEWREILESVSAIGNPLSRNEAHSRLKGMHKSRKYRIHFMDPRLFMRVHQLLSNYRLSLPARRFVLDLFKRCLRKMPWNQLDELYGY